MLRGLDSSLELALRDPLDSSEPDEVIRAMSEERKRVYTTPAGVALCALDVIGDQSARNFVLQIGDAFFHGFVVRRGEDVFGYVDRCPHQGLPLAHKLDEYLTPDKTLIHCAWHGALFRVEDGKCVGGPCMGARLSPWPVRVENGIVTTA